MAYPAKFSTLNALQLTDEARRTLTRIIRVAFPHPKIPDGPYERMADKIITEADDSTWFRVALTQGLLTLDSLTKEHFLDLPEDRTLAVLKRIGDLEFFGFIRRTTVLNFYDDPEVWAVLGYEGESFDKGGYLKRGFNDLDWLPEARIEECEEALTEVGPLGYVIAKTGPDGGAAPAAAAVPAAEPAKAALTDEPFDDVFKGTGTVEGGETA